MNEVVVTGAGIVSPLGNDLETFQERMFGGDSGVREIRGEVVPEGFPVPYAGRVDRGSLSLPPFLEERPRPLADCQRFAAAATHQALAALPPELAEELPFDAVVYGTTEALTFELVQEWLQDRDDWDWQETRGECSIEIIAELLARRGHGDVPARGRIALSSACATGNQAIGLAFQRIRSGRWRRALAGGVDARVVMTSLMSFHMLGALVTDDCPPERASRPFSIDRRGFVRSEGAASLVLESRAEAEARGAEILARVTGYAHTTDAHHFTEGREDCAGVIAAMAGALEDARRSPEEVDLISAHGTATPVGDRLETRAIRSLFGPAAEGIPVTALKSQMGHATVAAGAIEAVSAICMLREQRIAPTINYCEERVDPACDLDYVPNRARPASLQRALNNSIGFGGHNTALVLEREP